jgi:Lrp/AsnC family transcriptional regulator, leucine-responsive regulatory protein
MEKYIRINALIKSVNIKLDVKDRKILYELEVDARQSSSTIAKKVGLSREVVAYRIRQLEASRVIQYYVAIIDYVRLGFMFCRAFFRYNNVSPDIEEEMLSYLKKDPDVSWIGLGHGNTDMGVIYITQNINLLEESYSKFLYRFSGYFKSQNISLAFKIYHFCNTYLYANSDRNHLVVGANKTAEPIDELDHQILLALMKDPRMSIVDLSRKIGTSIKTANTRFKSLRDRGILLGFKCQINTRILNLEHHKIFLYLRRFDQENVQALIRYISHQNEVVYITVPFGSAHLEFELIVKGSLHLFEFMRTMNIKFPELIKDYDAAYFYRWPEINYIPRKPERSPISSS